MFAFIMKELKKKQRKILPVLVSRSSLYSGEINKQYIQRSLQPSNYLLNKSLDLKKFFVKSILFYILIKFLFFNQKTLLNKNRFPRLMCPHYDVQQCHKLNRIKFLQFVQFGLWSYLTLSFTREKSR